MPCAEPAFDLVLVKGDCVEISVLQVDLEEFKKVEGIGGGR